MANGTDAGPGARVVGVDEGAGATAPPLPPAAHAPGAPFPLDVSAGIRGLPDSRTDSVGNGTDSGPGARNVGADEGAGATAPPLRPAAPPLGAPFPLDVSAGIRGLPDSRTDSVGNGTDSGPRARNVGADEVPSATSSPLRPAAPPSRALLDASGAGGGVRDICDEVMERLVAGGHVNPGAMDLDLRELLAEHFGRFSESYQRYAQVMRAEDILIHMKLLKEATLAIGLPPFNVQFLTVERLSTKATGMDGLKKSEGAGDASSTRSGNIHEVVFAYIGNPKLRTKLSLLLADLGLNITHIHLFTTSDGYFLDAFTIVGWPVKGTSDLAKSIKESILRYMVQHLFSTLNSLPFSMSSVRSNSNRAKRYGSCRRVEIMKMRKRAEKVKEEKKMESFKAILSDSISFLFPTMITVLTSNYTFGEYEESALILFGAMGGLLILLTMVLSHGVDNGAGKTVVVSHLTLGTVIYVFGMLVYCLYKFFPGESDQIMALWFSVAHLIFGAAILTILWENSFK